VTDIYLQLFNEKAPSLKFVLQHWAIIFWCKISRLRITFLAKSFLWIFHTLYWT